MKRLLEDIELKQYAPYIREFEENAVLPIGPLDELRTLIWPQLAARTGSTLQLIINEIYREQAIRSGLFDD